MWRHSEVTLAIILTATALYSQTPAASQTLPADSKQQKPESQSKPAGPTAEEKWLYPAQRVSADLDEQSWRLKSGLKEVALATLGSYWWKQDRGTAERWVLPAVEAMTIVPQEESEIDRNGRVDGVRRLMAIVGPLDPMLRDRLRDVLSSATPKDNKFGSESARWRSADALVRAGEAGDSSHLGTAISDALQFGVTQNTAIAIADLYSQSPEEAQRLFDRALSAATASGRDLRAFIPFFDSEAGFKLPDAWRPSVERAFVSALNDQSLSQGSKCGLASELYSRVSGERNEVAQSVVAAFASCGMGSRATGEDSDLVQRENPQTSDDYLRVAAESKHASTRYQLKMTAGEKAEEEAKKDDNPGPDDGPVKALRILDGMTPEERAISPSAYKRRREDVAVRASLWTIRFSGCSAGLRVVDASPQETVLHVAVGVAEKMTSPTAGACYLEWMNTTVLRKLDRIPPEDPNDYIRTINLVLRRGPYPEQSLQQVLRAMDQWKEKDRTNVSGGEVSYTASWTFLYPLAITKELFDIPPDRLQAIARVISRNRLLEADFKLMLVKGFLDRYAQDLHKEKTEKAATAAR